MPPNVSVAVVEADAYGCRDAVLDIATGSRNGRIWRDRAIDTDAAYDIYAGWVGNAWNAKDSVRFFAHFTGAPAGYLILSGEPHDCRIEFFGVSAQFRNSGIGNALLSSAMAVCGGSLTAGTQRDNCAARHLYLARGFRCVESWRTFHA